MTEVISIPIEEEASQERSVDRACAGMGALALSNCDICPVAPSCALKDFLMNRLPQAQDTPVGPDPELAESEGGANDRDEDGYGIEVFDIQSILNRDSSEGQAGSTPGVGSTSLVSKEPSSAAGMEAELQSKSSGDYQELWDDGQNFVAARAFALSPEELATNLPPEVDAGEAAVMTKAPEPAEVSKSPVRAPAESQSQQSVGEVKLSEPASGQFSQEAEQFMDDSSAQEVVTEFIVDQEATQSSQLWAPSEVFATEELVDTKELADAETVVDYVIEPEPLDVLEPEMDSDPTELFIEVAVDEAVAEEPERQLAPEVVVLPDEFIETIDQPDVHDELQLESKADDPSRLAQLRLDDTEVEPEVELPKEGSSSSKEPGLSSLELIDSFGEPETFEGADIDDSSSSGDEINVDTSRDPSLDVSLDEPDGTSVVEDSEADTTKEASLPQVQSEIKPEDSADRDRLDDESEGSDAINITYDISESNKDDVINTTYLKDYSPHDIDDSISRGYDVLFKDSLDYRTELIGRRSVRGSCTRSLLERIIGMIVMRRTIELSDSLATVTYN